MVTLQHYARNRLGLLAVERASDRRFVGMCGIHEQDWYPDDLEIGWRLARECWGNGYATEAASAWLAYAFGAVARERPVPRVLSITDLDNGPSIGVMHRIGMQFDHEAELPDEDTGEPFPAVIHSISSEQWRDRAVQATCGCQTRSSPGT